MLPLGREIVDPMHVATPHNILLAAVATLMLEFVYDRA